jgi:predicted transcriptional regulator
MSLETLCDLFFEFSNEDRLRIIKRLKDDSLTVTALSKELDLTTQETSRHLTRLGETGLTVKNPDGTHSLTGYGELSLNQINGFTFTSEHRNYFQNHDLTSIPSEFVSRIGDLNGSRYIDDIMVIFHLIEELGKDSEEYIYRLTDRYILTAIPSWEIALKKGVEFRLLEPKNIVVPPEFDRGPVIREAAIRNQFQIRVIDEVNVFMALNEKKVAAISFPTNEGRMDYRGFVSEDKKVHKWAKDLYEYYWAKSTPKNLE